MTARIFLLLVLAAVMAGPVWGEATGPTAVISNSALDNRFPKWRIQSQLTGVVTVGLATGANRSKSFTLQCASVKDGARFDNQTVRFEEGNPVGAWRGVIDGYYIAYQAPPKGQTVPRALYSADGPHCMGAAMPNGLAAFEGYVAGDYFALTDIKKTAKNISLTQEPVDGSPCQVIAFDSVDYGQYRVWYDAAADWLPRKVEVHKNAQNIVGEDRLDHLLPRVPLGSKGPTQLSELSYTMDQATFDQIQHHWFPLSCRVTRVMRYADGNSETTTMQWRRLHIELNPSSTRDSFAVELREGAHLTNLANPHLPFQWKAGGPIPLVDQNTLTQMNRTAEQLQSAMQMGSK